MGHPEFGVRCRGSNTGVRRLVCGRLLDMAEETQAVLGIGSDDSIKVWLNGKLVHKNLVVRGVIADNDRVPVTFKKGKNQLVLKLLNCGGSWGFACRLLSTEPAGQ